jgi:hypothetical protein
MRVGFNELPDRKTVRDFEKGDSGVLTHRDYLVTPASPRSPHALCTLGESLRHPDQSRK